MIEVGVRELKSRLSYYLQLMQAGETIAVKVRNKVVGFLSSMKPSKESKAKKMRLKNLEKKIEQWKKEGILISGGLFHPTPFKPIKMTPGPTMAEIIRQMRDEE
ncbi:MAG: hypothetical protein A3H42_01490 [Deltaproteobacteria bacterium RIFCSPLOWO2_02_FULL_46_8]|nr:MAG: hypothetical protein A3H42_01490 [Deltaproteobacteria bacterium RIFCSPLOWO2_02_FULL_46_8]